MKSLTGDVIVVREDGIGVNKWPNGQVVETYLGHYGMVRAVSIHTAQGIYCHPTVKVTVLTYPD